MVETVLLYRSMFSGIPPPFACSWPTWCRTWAWCCRSLTKILTWEKTERNKEVIITTNAALLAKSRENSEYMKPFTIKPRNKQTTRQRTRLKVTVCLYLNPNNSARSLSTLMAVAVVRENPQKKKLKQLKVKSKICQFPLETSIKEAAKSGWAITQTQKSHIARQRSKNFVGGWIDDTLWSAMRIRVLPSAAVKARKMFKEKISTKDGLWLITQWSWPEVAKFPCSETFIIVLRSTEELSSPSWENVKWRLKVDDFYFIK